MTKSQYVRPTTALAIDRRAHDAERAAQAALRAAREQVLRALTVGGNENALRRAERRLTACVREWVDAGTVWKQRRDCKRPRGW